MRHYLSIFFWLCLFSSLYAQEAPTECAANAGKDKSICYTDAMSLSAPFNLNYTDPPGIVWTYLGNVPGVTIANPNDYNTAVTISSPTWPVGDYLFKFCVNCRDINLDLINDRPCDEVIITVKPDVTQPVITELDGVQDGVIKACSNTTFNATIPASGEMATITYLPDDNLVTHTIVNGVVTLTRASVNRQDACDYAVTYTISNGGCIKKTTVKVSFVSPYDPNNDGIIEGKIRYCPSCSNTLELDGDYPGCGGLGKWTKIAGPGTMTYNGEYLPSGDATVTVSLPGTYTFRYTVSNVSPCVTIPFDITCTVFQIGSFSIGPNKTKTFCQTTIPAGTYPYCFNQLSNTIYNWTTVTPGITFSNPHGNCSNVIVPAGISLLNGPVYIEVTATRYFQDLDCGGPLPAQLLVLPSTDPNVNWAFVQNLIASGACLQSCSSSGVIQFSGAPQVVVKAGPVNFLCSSGTETVKLADYFSVINLVNSLEVTVVSQPTGPNIPTLPSPLSSQELLQLTVNGCGQYKFKIVATNYDYAVNPPAPCTSTGYLTINIETPQQATAGTDQIKCLNEPIRLNANNPYCYAQGTWTQVGCTTCNVKIDKPHDPNTQIFLNGTAIPATLQFQWSFESEDKSCALSDITQVQVNNCIIPCSENLSVITTCVGGEICLTIMDQNNNIVDPSAYNISWPLINRTGNPVCIPNTGVPVLYDAVVSLTYQGVVQCVVNLSGIASCVGGCDARVTETCDECGNIILTLVDAATGNIIPPTTYLHEINWYIYGSGAGGLGFYTSTQNPVVIQQDAYYALNYQHYVYPPNVPNVPGYQTSICVFNIPKTPVSITCTGPCQDFNDFFIAGCGDNLDISLNLDFPPGCQSFCGSQGTAGTLGVFHTSNNMPVDATLFTIKWKNNANTTYVNGNLNLINTVTITAKSPLCCVWKDKYVPLCCSTPTPYIECQQPIVKYCRPDGTFYYIVGAPQIFWTPVPGTTGYNILVITGGIEGCCSGTSVMLPPQTVNTNIWSIPPGLNCFTIRVQAIIPGCPEPGPAWSNTYVYCPQEVVCNPVITVCGCCSGNYRSEEMSGLPTTIVSEEEVLAIIKANPGSEYVTLRDALNAAGTNVKAELEFNVFPNPASDQIVVKAGNTVKGTFNVQVTDLLQREWRNEAFDAAGEKTLNISDLPNGIYLVTIRNARGDQMMTEKIVVMK